MYFEWVNGNLVLDVDVVDVGGSQQKRVTIPRERLVEMISKSPDGMKFLLGPAMGMLRSRMKIQPSQLTNLAKAPATVNQILQTRRFSQSDDVLPPQIRDLEDRMIPVPILQTTLFPVKV